jgi:hypothetical protein
MRSDRRSVYDGLGADERAALSREFELGVVTARDGAAAGAARFIER